MDTLHVIIKPLITEKSLKDAAKGKYTFLVNKKANKTDIKKAVEQTFEVNVTGVMTNITKGSTTKNTKLGRKITNFSDKKARLTLKKGQSIPVFDEQLGLDNKNKDKKETKKEEVKGEDKKSKK